MGFLQVPWNTKESYAKSKCVRDGNETEEKAKHFFKWLVLCRCQNSIGPI